MGSKVSRDLREEEEEEDSRCELNLQTTADAQNQISASETRLGGYCAYLTCRTRHSLARWARPCRPHHKDKQGMAVEEGARQVGGGNEECKQH